MRFVYSSINSLVLCSVLFLSSTPAQARIWYAKEMTTQDYKKLDRNRTAVFISTGIMEEHGPYMPAYVDGYITEHIIKDVAEAVEKKGWDALVFPTFPIGVGACNEVGELYPYPGSFTVRAYTFRALYMDLVSEIGEAGFRYIFIGNDHGGPNHNRMIGQICAYFNSLYPDGRMSQLGLGFASSNAEIKKLEKEAAALMSQEAWKEDEHGGHADIEETSMMLHLYPTLVDSGFINGPAMTISKYGFGIQGMMKMAKSPEWTGYFGSPRWSTAKYGELRYKIHSLLAFVSKEVMSMPVTCCVDFVTGTFAALRSRSGLPPTR